MDNIQLTFLVCIWMSAIIIADLREALDHYHK